MKKSILAIAIVLLSCTAYGQIQTTKTKKVEDLPTHLKYDSLKNYLGMNLYAYIGQDLYLRPLSGVLRRYGYAHFYTSTDDNQKMNGENIYKCCDSYNASYDALQGKYFKVIGITRHPKAEEDAALYGKKFFLKLVEKESTDTCYYLYDGGSIEDMFPFTVVGYFAKCKKRYIGKKYITQGIRWSNTNADEKDIETAKSVSITKGKVWTVEDVTIDDQYYELSLILKSQQGEKVAISLLTTLKSCYFVCGIN